MLESRNIKAVLFDMDGVLIDARDWHYHALNAALQPFGFEITYEDHLSRFNGLSTGAKLNILTEEFDFPESLHMLVNEVKQDRTLRIAGQFCYPIVQHQILVSRLRKKGFATGVVTNSIRKTAEILLSHAQLLNMIDVLVTNQDIQNQKPSPDCYLLACSKLGLSPSEVLVIEDGDYGITAAKLAGCRVIQVNSPSDVSLELLAEELPQLLVGSN